LFASLDLIDVLRDQPGDMAKLCFRWICKRHQMKIDKWHARLIMVKNAAYAWRQMVFFLALLPDRSLADFLVWAEDHLSDQSEEFRNRFRPALKGLIVAADGGSIDSGSARREGVRRVLGWSKERHCCWPIVTAHREFMHNRGLATIWDVSCREHSREKSSLHEGRTET